MGTNQNTGNNGDGMFGQKANHRPAEEVHRVRKCLFLDIVVLVTSLEGELRHAGKLIVNRVLQLASHQPTTRVKLIIKMLI